jgi:CHASE3 domain sensor protein
VVVEPEKARRKELEALAAVVVVGTGTKLLLAALAQVAKVLQAETAARVQEALAEAAAAQSDKTVSLLLTEAMVVLV